MPPQNKAFVASIKETPMKPFSLTICLEGVQMLPNFSRKRLIEFLLTTELIFLRMRWLPEWEGEHVDLAVKGMLNFQTITAIRHQNKWNSWIHYVDFCSNTHHWPLLDCWLQNWEHLRQYNAFIYWIFFECQASSQPRNIFENFFKNVSFVLMADYSYNEHASYSQIHVFAFSLW